MIAQLLRKPIILLSLVTGLMSSFSVLVDSSSVQARPLGSPAGNSSTGAVRGACPAIDTKLQNHKLLALVDASDPALTTQARPTFWFYLPFKRTEEVTTAEFELLDENQEPVLSTRKLKVALPEQAGIVRLTLPAGEPALQAGKEYFWVFRVVCDPDDRSGNPTVTGWIKRVQPETALVSQLKSLPQADQYKAYAASKIWFERINLLAQNRDKHSQDWLTLLNSFGLQSLGQQPMRELTVESSKP